MSFSSKRTNRLLHVTRALLVGTLIPFVEHAATQDKPSLSAIDRTRLIETFRLADRLGDRIWPSWSKAPFAVLLVTPENEFLIRHPKPSPDFTSLGFDPSLKSEVYYR